MNNGTVTHRAERTCIGCRGLFPKHEVVRVVAGPSGMMVDYREKLPGRGAYVCPRPDCIKKALSRGNIERALRVKIKTPSVEEFTSLLTAAVRGKIQSLLHMAAKAGKIVTGYSAVRDGLEKGRVKSVIYAADVSDGSREKIADVVPGREVKQSSLFTRDELGRMFGRELVGVVGIEDKGFADAVWKEAERLKSLINIGRESKITKFDLE